MEKESIDLDQAHYCLIGDSHVARIAPHHFTTGLIQVAGFGGADTRRLKHIARNSTGQCRHIVVMPGANDALNSRCPSLTLSDSVKMIEALALHTERITIVAPFSMPKAPDAGDHLYDILYMAMETAHLRYPHTIIELEYPMTLRRFSFSDDNVHLTVGEQSRLATYLQGFLHGYCHDEEPRPYIPPPAPPTPPPRSGGFGMPPTLTTVSTVDEEPLSSTSAPTISPSAQSMSIGQPQGESWNVESWNAASWNLRDIIGRDEIPTSIRHLTTPQQPYKRKSQGTGSSKSPPNKQQRPRKASPKITQKRKRTHTPPTKVSTYPRPTPPIIRSTTMMEAVSVAAMANEPPTKRSTSANAHTGETCRKPHETATNEMTNEETLHGTLATTSTVSATHTSTESRKPPSTLTTTITQLSTVTTTPTTQLIPTNLPTTLSTHTTIPTSASTYYATTTPSTNMKSATYSSTSIPQSTVITSVAECILTTTHTTPCHSNEPNIPIEPSTIIPAPITISTLTGDTAISTPQSKQNTTPKKKRRSRSILSTTSAATKAKERERKSLQRQTFTPEGNELRREKQRERTASCREAETPEKTDARLRKKRERSASCRAAETMEESDTRRQTLNERRLSRREAETSEESEARRLRECENARLRREAETPLQREVRLADLRDRAVAALEEETPSDTEQRRAAATARQRTSRMARLREVLRTKKQLGRINDVSYFDEGVLANLTNGQIFHRLPLLKQPSNKCDHCGAYVWRSGDKTVSKERPGFCCENGKVPYEPPQEPPEVLRALYLDNPRHADKSFLDNLRSYNNSLALASLGCNEIRMPGFSPTFKIQGKVYHAFGSLIPPDGDEPSFAQIYFNDTDHEVDNRLRHNPHLDRDILGQLQNCIHDVNIHVQNLKKAIDFNIEQPDVELIMQANAPLGQHERRYNLPTAGEVAALLPGEQAGKRDVLIQTHGGELMRIDTSSPLYDPLHYVLLFPYGTSGYTHKLPHSEGYPKDITPYEFYRVRLQIRDEPDTYLLRSRRLMQQYVCDQEAKAEGFRMKWARDNQRTLKAEKYRDLQDAVHANDERRAGSQIVLPPSFTGGPRWYAAKFQDAMAIVREKGKPSAFVTITCNPKWPEITENLLPGQTAADRPDLCVRVFHLKLAAFIDDLDKEQALGRVVSYLAMKEDQKRGLPHAHILLIFADADRLHGPETVDRIISAEIPDPELNPELHAVITTNNMHGPCGNFNSHSSCMVKGDNGRSTCSKNYPKDFQNNTIITDERFPEYRRRSPDNGGLTHTTSKGLVLDNRWVVPYNPYLSAKYQCHINVEFVHTVASVKYLYKYLCKGSDRVMVRVDDGSEQHDEITSYEDARYIGCTDAFWRICEFNIQLRYPPVEQLPLHLEDHQIVLFTDDNASEIAAGPAPITKLTAFFDLNQTDPTANAIKYPDIYRHYTWQRDRWIKRKNRMGGHHRDPDSEDMSETVGRIPIIAFTPHQSEVYFLRMLLYHKCGPTSYEDLRTVEGVVAPSFQEACRRLGFLDDDTIIDSVMAEVGGATFGSQLRAIFSTILIWITPSDCPAFWLRHRGILCEDLMRRDDVRQPTDAIINEVLLDIQENLQSCGYDLKKNFKLDLPDMQAIEARAPREIRDETEFDQDIQNDIVDRHADQFNEEQRHFYNTVMASVANDEGRLIGLDAPGGCGKTFCLEAILAAVRSDGGIALATATSGIAATLLPNGRTLHSRFKVPLKVHEATTSQVTKRSATGELIGHCKLVVIDEVTMAHRHVYECVDRTFRFIREDDRPFGGATVVFSGDWRQILPVIKRGRPADVLRACLKKSPLWDHVTVMSLTMNMRVQQAQGAEQEFAQYLLDIGDGRVEVFPDLSEYKIKLPEHFTSDMSSVHTLCQFVFDNLQAHTADPTWLCSRAILCPTNKATTDINAYMLKRFPGHERIYKSSDKITDCPNAHHYPAEYLNTIEVSGMPRHEIRLKLGVPVMLLRNLDPARGHCNGTRYTVVALHDHVIEVKVAVGVYAGNAYFIPRIPLSPTENYFPFTFTRRQFPVRVCFGMTSNKAQGQTLSRIGLYLPKDFFAHGQLYVALSRVGSAKSIKILTKNGKFVGKDGIFTENVVLGDILK